MDLFTLVEDAHVIIVRRGVAKQVKVYSRSKRLYAAHAGGYIGLRLSGSTTCPDVRWLETDVEHKVGRLGVLELP